VQFLDADAIEVVVQARRPAVHARQELHLTGAKDPVPTISEYDPSRRAERARVRVPVCSIASPQRGRGRIFAGCVD
jgi:hypothetical protein